MESGKEERSDHSEVTPLIILSGGEEDQQKKCSDEEGASSQQKTECSDEERASLQKKKCSDEERAFQQKQTCSDEERASQQKQTCSDEERASAEEGKGRRTDEPGQARMQIGGFSVDIPSAQQGPSAESYVSSFDPCFSQDFPSEAPHNSGRIELKAKPNTSVSGFLAGTSSDDEWEDFDSDQ